MRRSLDTKHEWTEFEKTTLLGLLVKGAHLEAKQSNKDKNMGRAKKNAYLNVADELNRALNGERGFADDIPKREVTRMVDHWMDKKKAVVGKGGVMERSSVKVLTRSLRMMFERESKMDFDGSLGEWELWRREEVEEKIRMGKEGVAKEPDHHKDASRNQATSWQRADQAQANSFNTTNWQPSTLSRTPAAAAIDSGNNWDPSTRTPALYPANVPPPAVPSFTSTRERIYSFTPSHGFQSSATPRHISQGFAAAASPVHRSLVNDRFHPRSIVNSPARYSEHDVAVTTSRRTQEQQLRDVLMGEAQRARESEGAIEEGEVEVETEIAKPVERAHKFPNKRGASLAQKAAARAQGSGNA